MREGSLETILILFLAVWMCADLVLAIAAFGLIRIHFGHYVRRAHRPLWDELVPPGSAWVHPGYGFDVTGRLREFRVAGIDLDDPELSRRRLLANTAERALVIGVVGLIAGGLLLGSALAFVASLRSPE